MEGATHFGVMFRGDRAIPASTVKEVLPRAGGGVVIPKLTVTRSAAVALWCKSHPWYALGLGVGASIAGFYGGYRFVQWRKEVRKRGVQKEFEEKLLALSCLFKNIDEKQIECLILKGADVNKPVKVGNVFSYPPLALLCKGFSDYSSSVIQVDEGLDKVFIELINFLLAQGVAVNGRVEGRGRFGKWTAMHFACNGGCFELRKLLEQKGASLQVKNAQGKKPGELWPK
ncbi:TPA: hypothetical protein DDZ86_03535 [Candidatus Dependentiae bacterium]|nr:hypothetical protein [Candidatus Dependentiae bacterium]